MNRYRHFYDSHTSVTRIVNWYKATYAANHGGFRLFLPFSIIFLSDALRFFFIWNRVLVFPLVIFQNLQIGVDLLSCDNFIL